MISCNIVGHVVRCVLLYSSIITLYLFINTGMFQRYLKIKSGYIATYVRNLWKHVYRYLKLSHCVQFSHKKRLLPMLLKLRFWMIYIIFAKFMWYEKLFGKYICSWNCYLKTELTTHNIKCYKTLSNIWLKIFFDEYSSVA